MDIKQQLRELSDPDRNVMDATVEGELATLRRIQIAAEELIRDQVRNGRSLGLSWSEIAAPLGISKQAAHERFS